MTRSSSGSSMAPDTTPCPPRYLPLVSLVAAARTPATEAELAGQDAAVAMFRARRPVAPRLPRTVAPSEGLPRRERRRREHRHRRGSRDREAARPGPGPAAELLELVGIKRSERGARPSTSRPIQARPVRSRGAQQPGRPHCRRARRRGPGRPMASPTGSPAGGRDRWPSSNGPGDPGALLDDDALQAESPACRWRRQATSQRSSPRRSVLRLVGRRTCRRRRPDDPPATPGGPPP